MPAYRSPVVMAVALALRATLIFEDVYAQTVADTVDNRAQIVITGTRVQNRSALETAVPVDVLTSDVFQNRGVPEVSQAGSQARSDSQRRQFRMTSGGAVSGLRS
jgi:iron complex outermembrane recepter protein